MKNVLLALFLLLCLCAVAQPRFTDSTFGTNGKVVENSSVPYVDMIDALLQPDGKTLILAASTYNAINRTVLIRYNTDGTADGSFSSDGIADSLITPGENCNPKAIRLQTNGKILVCGDVGDYFTKKPFVMRYNTDGSLDASFGTAGILYLPSFSVYNPSVNLPSIDNLAILSNGKIMLLSTRYYPNTDFALIRLNSSGFTDSTFGTNGMVIINPPGVPTGNPQIAYTHLEVQTDGRYVVGGSTYTSVYLLARVTTNGTIDNTYGSGGLLTVYGSPSNDGLADMVIQPDNKIVVCGMEQNSGRRTYISIIRITTTGTPDATFGSNGRRVIYANTTGFATSEPQLNLQADGKILIGGMAKKTDGNFTMAIARLTAAGVLDATFDGDGIALLQVNGYNSFGKIPLQQADGKIIITGFARNNNKRSPTIGRFTAAGQTDATLNDAAVVTILNNGTDYEDSYNVLVQPADQKIVSVRERGNGYGGELCVSRHLTNGQPDTDFGINGKAYLDMPGYNYQYWSGLSADGKITIIPDYADYTTGGTLAVFRIKSNGQTDSSFGQYGRKIFKSRNTDTIGNYLGSAVVQADGKILMAVGQSEGVAPQYIGRDSSFLIRLKNDGSFDSSFSGTGKKYLATYSSGTKMIVQPDGKIVLAHTINPGNNAYKTAVRRLNVDGSTDTSFNKGVAKITGSECSQITLQPDGKILLISFTSTVTRLLNNGNDDTTFGINGVSDVISYYPTDNYYFLNNIKADNNHIFLMGNFYDSMLVYPVIKVIALQNSGAIDSSFGQFGVVFPEIATEPYAYEGLRMALQSNGKVIVTGHTTSPNSPNLTDFALIRLKSTNTTTTGRLYTFTGSGLWSNPANWADGTVPPTTIPAGSSIVIDPPTGSECVIDITVQVQTGASVTIKAGKKVRLPGNLIIQ